MTPYRPIQTAGEWAAWLDSLKKRSGVYVIRRTRGRGTLYVGESHSGRLRKTLMRHFWHWKGKTAGVTYDPDDVEVAVEPLPPSQAVTRQNELIHGLKPEDNVIDPIQTEKDNAADAADDADDGDPF
jgi:hypothetical protein